MYELFIVIATYFHLDGRLGPIQLIQLGHFLMECLYQAKKDSGHAFVRLEVRNLPLITILFFDFGIISTL